MSTTDTLDKVKKSSDKAQNKKEKPAKGTYGYIDYTKKKALIMSVLSLLSVLIIFFTGIVIYKTNKSLFSVIAAVASLPAAKLITGYLVRIPYKTGDRDIYDRLIRLASENEVYQAVIGADFIISSPESAMSVAYAYIINGKAMCYTCHPKTDAKKTEKYIKEFFDRDGCQYSQIRVFDNEKKFLSAIEAIASETGKEYTDKRIYEKLCAYSM